MLKSEGFEAVKSLFSNLGAWVNNGSRDNVDKAAKDLARGYQKAIEAGLEADGSPMASLKKATLEGPVRRQDNSQIRGNLGSKPLSATGQTARSIQAKKVKSDEWEISSNTDLGDKILSSNASGRHRGDKPFSGDVSKVKRDPLQVSDKQIDTVEDELFKALDRIVNG